MRNGIPTTVEVQIEGTTRTCRVRGAIEAWNVADIVEQLLPSKGERLMLDLGGVREVDSTGLGELIDLHQKLMRTGSQLALVNPSPAVQRLLETTRLCRYFTILDSDEAVNQFKTAG